MIEYGDPYCSRDEYRHIISKSDDGEDTQVDLDLAAITTHINNELGRWFWRDATATTRIYVPSNAYGLTIDDAVSVSAVAVDDDDDGTYGTALTATDYELIPLNAATGPEPWPYTGLRMLSEGLPYVANLRTGKPRFHRVRVTGIHGWPAVPAPIVQACAQLTGILRLESPRATTRVDEVGTAIGTSRAANEIIRALMERYQKSARHAFMLY